MHKALYTVREVAALLNVGQRKARELAQKGRIETIRLGTRSIRYTRESVERLARLDQDDDRK